MKQEIIELLSKSTLRNKWEQYNHNCKYGHVETECYDANGKRYSTTLFYGEDDTVYLINTGYSIGVSVNSQSFIYGDVVKFTNLSNGHKCEVCFSEVNCNE